MLNFKRLRLRNAHISSTLPWNLKTTLNLLSTSSINVEISKKPPNNPNNNNSTIANTNEHEYNQNFQNTSNNEIEAYLANQTYGLEPQHLATIRARLIRSPYNNRKNIVVWNEDLVKLKALDLYKTEKSILRATRRKNSIRKRQFEKITKYIESSERSKKIEEEKFLQKIHISTNNNYLNNNTNNRYNEKQAAETKRLYEIIKKHGGISFADLILDEVIEIYEKSALHRKKYDYQFVLVDPKKGQKGEAFYKRTEYFKQPELVVGTVRVKKGQGSGYKHLGLKSKDNIPWDIISSKKGITLPPNKRALGQERLAQEELDLLDVKTPYSYSVPGTDGVAIGAPGFGLQPEPEVSLSNISRIKTNPGVSLSESATRVTLIAAVTNGLITVWKLVVALATNSATMYGEVYHSLGDTLMQIMLYMSHKFSDRYGPSEKYPYGFKQMPQIASLTSGILIFSMGAWTSLLSGFHIVKTGTEAAGAAEAVSAISGAASGGGGFSALLYNPFVVLGVSFVLESYSMYNAYVEVKAQAERKNLTFLQQLKSGTDPTTSVVFLEDSAAVAGLAIAATCLALMNSTGMIMFDGIGSMGIGSVLAYISYKLTTQSALALMGKSVPLKQLGEMRDQLENDTSVKAVFDMKCTYVTPSLYRLKAEVEFDGRHVCDHYLQKQNLSELRRQMKQASKSDAAAREFLLQHSSATVDQLGKDIDRIEKGMKANHKDLRHIDLELN